jgi:hypothetical protein
MNNVDWYSPGGLINQYLEKELKIAHTVRILLRSSEYSVLHGYAPSGAHVYFMTNQLDNDIWQVTNFNGGIEDFLNWFQGNIFQVCLEDVHDLCEETPTD